MPTGTLPRARFAAVAPNQPGGVADRDEAVDEIERRQRELRGEVRGAAGVGAHLPPLPSLGTGVARAGGWYPLVALSLIVVADQLHTFAFAALTPDISRSLGVSRGGLSFLLFLKTLAVVGVALPMAAAVAHRPRRAMVAKVATVGWVAATVVSAVALEPWALFLAVVLAGVAAGSIEAVHRPLLVDAHPPDVRVRVLSFYRGAFVVGTLLTPVVVGVVTAGLGLTWRAGFLAVAAVSLLAAVVALRLNDPGFGRWDTEPVRAAVRRDAGEDVAATSQPEPELRVFEVVRRLMLIPTIRRLLAVWAVIGMASVPLSTFLFFFLDERWNMGAGGRLLVFAGAWAFALPALAWFGPRGEAMFRDDPARLAAFVSSAFLAVVAGLVVAVAVPVVPGAVVGFGVVFAATTLVVPALNVVMLSIVPPRMRAHVSALAAMFLVGVGGIGGVVLLNGMDRRFGIGGAIASIALPALLAAWLARTASKTVDADFDRMLGEIVEREEIEILHRRGSHLPMLSCRRIDFSYGQLQVLFEVDFTVEDGQMVALLGTNGAGKSTLLRVISGLGLPSKGSVHFHGADITFLDAERRVAAGITQIPGGKATFGPLTVVENLRVYGYSLGRDHRSVERGIEASLEAFPRLAERRNQLASTLSGGEQQMLALGKAFILRPRLLLIDELSLGLAPKIVGELLDMVRRVNATGTAVVLVEQSVNIALSLVQHAYFMEKGEIRFDGPAAGLLERRDLLRSVFLEGASKGFS